MSLSGAASLARIVLFVHAMERKKPDDIKDGMGAYSSTKFKDGKRKAYLKTLSESLEYQRALCGGTHVFKTMVRKRCDRQKPISFSRWSPKPKGRPVVPTSGSKQCFIKTMDQKNSTDTGLYIAAADGYFRRVSLKTRARKVTLASDAQKSKIRKHDINNGKSTGVRKNHMGKKLFQPQHVYKHNRVRNVKAVRQ